MADPTKALGMIETRGIPALFAAADAAAKTADVQVTAYEKADAGIVTIYVLGDVSSVKTAVEAGAEAAKKVGILLATHVIARPDASVYAMVRSKLPKPTTDNSFEEKIQITLENGPNEPELAELGKRTVSQLRVLARQIPDFPLSAKEIGTAKKALLLKLLTERDNEERGGVVE
ncbi:BMC domain-containing protein [Cohnella endophytica]|uniref:BMC domain-containing protein n=1 Tax=Cohnella endophytica TaxID=2419778 RepID=A0A494Y2H7_9BACL|nr:BMC domain-containing protein [Cohnella endophytica]RKP54066.1 BMC domain-containing protein [Cohnella endophytica]